MQLFLATAAGGLILSGLTGFVAYDKGKKAERLIWESANVETLVLANNNLSLTLEGKDAELAELRLVDVNAVEQTTRVETRIIEKIKEVPVEKVIKISDDCRVDYGLIGLRNSWAEGYSLNEAARETATGYLPLVGARTLSDETGANKSYPK